MELLSYSTSSLSLVAPAVAIILAILTRHVLFSLGAGILAGALLLTDFSAGRTFSYLLNSFSGIFWDDGLNTGTVFILLFLVILGIITTLIDVSGGARAFGDWARQRVKSRQGSQLVTVLLGIIIFIDDYFNALAVGNIGRPMTDRQGVSRAKLAYLIDSTAAPVCVITPVSSWGAYIIALIGTILVAHEVTDVTAIGAFVSMVPMNLYAVFALALVFCTAAMDLNIGPMRIHERRARAGELYDSRKGTPPGSSEAISSSEKGTVADLVIPVLSLVMATTASLIATGASALQEAGTPFSVLGAFENTNVVNSLIYGGLAGLLVTAVRMLSHNLDASTWGKAVLEGTRSMLPAIYILVLAWVLVDIISSLETGKYLAHLVSSSKIDTGYLPLILFVVSGAMAFSTGTSWGTFGIMLPIAGDMAAAADIAMILPMLAAVLAGAVFGDHCSPISDTTILSSTGASCHHIDHVMTQLPYALSIAVVAMLGYLVMGLTDSSIMGFLASGAGFILLVLAFRKMSARQMAKSEDHLVAE
ncbi:Na+/H+ antiporter NhaC family protein [Endozoicomonas sp. 8E]|uniref:Na+/H+ antiporter NhaC family protein n=1 Tax=Endozoicomonas sp. 8E TaxID=3035692 RepID=UPI0029394E23|nr:Na+/H+ antiporter NhaC family protein [Endozoicomonas sp. 8E]WOG25696.1 Na+/H+ antiporter NhaC family protein [Endozoicomonas sp. 8E]